MGSGASTPTLDSLQATQSIPRGQEQGTIVNVTNTKTAVQSVLDMYRANKYADILSFAMRVDEKDPVTGQWTQRAHEVLDFVAEIQLAYKKYVQKCLELETKIQVFMEDTTQTANGSKFTSKAYIKTILSRIIFQVDREDYSAQFCSRDLFSNRINLVKGQKPTLATPIPSRRKFTHDQRYLVYIPLHITWPATSLSPESGHELGMYYVTKSRTEPAYVYIFEPGGGGANMWPFIKDQVKTAISFFHAEYVLQYHEHQDLLLPWKEDTAGISGRLAGVEFEKKLTSTPIAAGGQQTSLSVYVNNDEFMFHHDAEKRSDSKCAWACLRFFSWVVTNNQNNIPQIPHQPYPIYQEFLVGLCAYQVQEVPNTGRRMITLTNLKVDLIRKTIFQYKLNKAAGQKSRFPRCLPESKSWPKIKF